MADRVVRVPWSVTMAWAVLRPITNTSNAYTSTSGLLAHTRYQTALFQSAPVLLGKNEGHESTVGSQVLVNGRMDEGECSIRVLIQVSFCRGFSTLAVDADCCLHENVPSWSCRLPSEASFGYVRGVWSHLTDRSKVLSPPKH